MQRLLLLQNTGNGALMLSGGPLRPRAGAAPLHPRVSTAGAFSLCSWLTGGRAVRVHGAFSLRWVPVPLDLELYLWFCRQKGNSKPDKW